MMDLHSVGTEGWRSRSAVSQRSARCRSSFIGSGVSKLPRSMRNTVVDGYLRASPGGSDLYGRYIT